MTELVPTNDGFVVPAPQDLSEKSLEDLAELVNKHHVEVLGGMFHTLRYAIAAGEVLIEARSRVGRGWLRWCEDRLELSSQTVSAYMRVAHHRDLVLEEGCRTIEGGLKFLQLVEAPRLSGLGGKPIVDIDIDRARALHAEGLSWRAVARILNVDHSTLSARVNPESRRRANERRSAKNRALRAAKITEKKVARDAAREEAIKHSDDKSAKAYELVRKTALLLDAALAESNDPEQRDKLRIALVSIHSAEDNIVRALRLGRVIE